MTRASPKYCSVVAPRIWAPMTSTDSTGRMATSEVLMDRASVWFIDRLTTSVVGHPPDAPKAPVFSLTRSNTTTVS